MMTARRMRRAGAGGGAGGKENAEPPPPSSSSPYKAAAPASTPTKAASTAVPVTPEPPAVLSLRKELADATTGRAEMEMEYMNLLSSIESEKRTTQELLDARTRERDGLRKQLTELREEVDELRGAAEGEREDHRREVERLTAGQDELDGILRERDGELAAVKATLEEVGRRGTHVDEASQKSTAALKKMVDDAMWRLDEETSRFQRETAELRKEKEKAEERAKQEAEKSVASQESAAVLRREVEGAMERLEAETARFHRETSELRREKEKAVESARQEAEKSAASQQSAALLRREVEGAMERLEVESTRFREETSILRREKEEIEGRAEQQAAASAASREAAALIRGEVEGAMLKLDKETKRFEERTEALRRERDEAVRRAQQEAIASAAAREATSKLRAEAEDSARRLDEERKRFEEEVVALQRGRDEAKKSAETGEASSARAQADVAELQARLVVKDQEIEALRGTVAKSRECSDSLKAEVEELGDRARQETDRADALSGELEAIKMARSLSRSASPTSSVEDRLEREKRHAADRREIDRLEALVAEKDACISDGAAEIAAVRTSARTSEEKSRALAKEMDRLTAELDAAAEGARNRTESDANADGFQRSLDEANTLNAALKGELKDLTARFDAELSNMSALQLEVDAQRHKADDLREQLQTKRAENNRLKSDLQELCDSMKDLASARREELDEMQSQISHNSKTASMKEKECQILELTLEETRLKHKKEIEWYERKLREAGPNPVSETVVEQYRGQVGDLQKKNSYLRSQLASQTVELDKLRARVDGLTNTDDSFQTVTALRERNEVLKREVVKLRRRYDALEGQIKRVSV